MPQLPLASIEWTEEEYLAFEDDSRTKHEYLDGQVMAMPDGYPLWHNVVASHMLGSLGEILHSQRTQAMAGATPDHNAAKTRSVEHHHRGSRGWNKPIRRQRGAIKVLGGVIQVAELFEGLDPGEGA